MATRPRASTATPRCSCVTAPARVRAGGCRGRGWRRGRGRRSACDECERAGASRPSPPTHPPCVRRHTAHVPMTTVTTATHAHTWRRVATPSQRRRRPRRRGANDARAVPPRAPPGRPVPRRQRSGRASADRFSRPTGRGMTATRSAAQPATRARETCRIDSGRGRERPVQTVRSTRRGARSPSRCRRTTCWLHHPGTDGRRQPATWPDRPWVSPTASPRRRPRRSSSWGGVP